MFGRKATLPIDLDMAKHNGDKKMKKLIENGEELAASDFRCNKRIMQNLMRSTCGLTK